MHVNSLSIFFPRTNCCCFALHSVFIQSKDFECTKSKSRHGLQRLNECKNGIKAEWIEWLDSGSWNSIDVDTTAIFFLLFMFRLLRFSHDRNVNFSWRFMYVYLRFSQYFGHFPLISFSSPIYFLRSFYFGVLGKYANVQLCFSHDMNWMANTLSDLCFVLQYFDILWVPNFIWRSACDLKWWCVCRWVQWVGMCVIKYHQYLWYFPCSCSIKGKKEPQKAHFSYNAQEDSDYLSNNRISVCFWMKLFLVE